MKLQAKHEAGAFPLCVETLHVTKALAAFAVLLTAAAPARQQTRHAEPAPGAPPRQVPAIMPIDTWSSLVPEPSARTPRQPGGTIDTRVPPAPAEEITVIGRNRHYDADARADIRAGDIAYEASNSASAQPLLPFPEYTSPEQQRLMSDKTEFLGLCGALGGYIQCPNRAP